MSDVDKFISSDAFEGRGPATRAETKTINYIADQMKAIGLKPAGDTVNGQRGWFQNVPLLKSDFAGTPQFALNLGNGRTLPADPGRSDRAEGAAQRTEHRSILPTCPLLFVGYGVIRAGAELGRFQGPVDVRGKLLVVLDQRPRFRRRRGRLRRQGDDLLRPLDLQI